VIFDYYLAVSSDWDVASLRQAVARLTGAAETPDRTFELPALTIAVDLVDRPTLDEAFREQLGVPPTAYVYFGLDVKSPERESARESLSVTAANIAVSADAEAALTYGLEHLALSRRKGQLTLYRWHDEWAWPRVRDQLPEPYLMSSDDIRY
jgi:hypothetical protein